MAVWLQIIGKRNIESLEKEKEKIINIINNIELDLSFILDSSYSAENWKIKKNGEIEYFEYKLDNDSKNTLNSIRIIFNSFEFIEFSGPFEFFSEWFLLGDKYGENISEGWKSIFAEISKSYGISELYYFSEWFFATELIHSGEENANQLFESFLVNKENQKKSLTNLNHNEFYKQHLI